jgi:hypothetical protein
MSRLKKLMLVLIGVPVLLIIVAVVGLVLFIDSAAKTGIEKGATYAMGVNTTLDSASIGLFSGKFGLSGLKVANPAGYKDERFLSLGDGRVAVSLGSLTKDTIEVPTFALDTITVNLEKKDGKANYQVILDNLAKLSKGDPSSAPPEQGGGKKLIINELTIRNVTVKADLLGAPGAVGAVVNQPITIPISEIKLTNVGKDTGRGVAGSGVTVSQLSSIIVQAVLAAAVENGGNLLPGDIAGELKGALGNLGDLKNVGVQVVGKAGEAAQQIGKQLEGAANEAQKKLEKAGEELGDKLKGILPGKGK